jgi:L-lactate dehydrogenase complex protein LldG
VATNSKERILKKIRKALTQSTPQPFPNVEVNNQIFQPQTEDLEIIFAEQFTAIQGNFIYCESEAEFISNINALVEEKKWNNLFGWENDLVELFKKHNNDKLRIGRNLDRADVGVTLCEALIARTGTILLSSKQQSGRSLNIYPPIHICVAFTHQLVYDMKEALQNIAQKYEGNMPSMITLATGPSRTADIEKTLVLGAHGPKEVYVFLIDSNAS